MSTKRTYLKDVAKKKNGLLLETVNEALGKAKKEPFADNEALAKVLGLGAVQFERAEKALHERIIHETEVGLADTLVSGTPVEIKGTAQLYVQVSKTRKNKLEKPHERLAIRNRTVFKGRLNK
jgi:hypothetical protein